MSSEWSVLLLCIVGAKSGVRWAAVLPPLPPQPKAAGHVSSPYTVYKRVVIAFTSHYLIAQRFTNVRCMHIYETTISRTVAHCTVIMVALWNRADRCIFILSFLSIFYLLLLLFFLA